MTRPESLFTIILIFFFSAATPAHPLGNFSINQYSRLEVRQQEIKIRQVLDIAEIPTFQHAAEIDKDKDGRFSEAELKAFSDGLTPRFISNLHLMLDGAPLTLTVIDTTAETVPGAGDLNTLRMAWNISAKLPDPQSGGRVEYRNENYADRIGWREIIVNGSSGVEVFNSSAFGSSLTDELRAYPQDLLTVPLNEQTAEFSFSPGAIPPDAKPLLDRDGRVSVLVAKDRLAELISVPEITPTIALFGLLLAFGLGALHAMSPGHGKTVVGAYLVGSKGTPKDAAFLGLTVTVTHTLGVFALGVVTLFASNYVMPEKLMPFLSFVSGLLVFFIGVTLFKDRLFSILGWRAKVLHNDHPHAHGEHEHSQDGLTHTHDGHSHTHAPPDAVTWRGLLALGISGGLLPCPSALVLMLSAISLGRVGYGLILTLVFSLGLSATLTGVGLIFLYVGKAFGGSPIARNRIFKAVPVFSAFIIACIGAVICYNSLGQR